MSNLTQRILTALVAIPIIVFLCLQGGIAFFLFIAAASGVALYEFYMLAAAKGAQPLIIPGLLAGFMVNLAFFHARFQTALVGYLHSLNIPAPFPSQSQLLMMVLLVSVLVIMIIELFRNKGSGMLNIATTVLGVVYISMFFGTFIGLREIFIPQDFPILRYFPDQSSLTDPALIERIYRWGGYTVISILATIWICDTAAFHAGTALGKHKLYPRVSPNKSWEGAVFGFIFAILSAVAARYLVLEYLTLTNAIVIGAIVGTVGQIGDLAESLLKRDAGVKDSSRLIPGHGGVFDRFDSLLFVAPCVYLYIDFIILT